MPVRTCFFIIWSVFFLSVTAAKADLLQVHEDLIYDTVLNVYWAKSERSTDQVTWDKAHDWINGLNDKNFGGYNDWRLPYTPDGTWRYDGGNDGKYNVKASELGHLYYNILGLSSRQNETANTAAELQKSPFLNLLPTLYWLGPLSTTPLNLSDNKPTGDPAAWVFDFGYGSQFLQTTNMYAYAIAVRSASPVPEPSSVVLFLTGVLMMARIRSRQNCSVS
jgi:hypothetical protein